MKIFIRFIILVLFVKSVPSFGQNEIVGKWLNPEKNAVMQIYESEGRYFGKLVSGSVLYEQDKKTLKKDLNNESPALKNRTMLNQDILKNLRFKNGLWDKGSIYDPVSGKTYDCLVRYKVSTIELRGYLRSPVFGESTIWTKI